MTAKSTSRQDRATPSEQEFDRLLFEISGRIEAGEPIVVDEVAGAHPEFAERLRELLPTLHAMNELGHLSYDSLAVDADTENPPTHSTSFSAGLLGDFRLRAEIGRGGMGVVYDAEQISLNRRVALKILPFASVLDPRQIQRFKNEALAAAQLDHPHIVNVFGVGCERSVYYYAMRLIEGRTLSQVISSLRDDKSIRQVSEGDPVATITLAGTTVPSQRTGESPDFFQAVARLGVQIADALDFAHQHGIVHRDIKPANVMIDNAGKPWVTDFGLAQIESVPGLTLTGDVVGTLRYMSPEQALANRVVVDHRTDIYSLGATLYELATLQPAFPDVDRQELIRMIACEEPQSPRQIAPAMPVELETIIQKSMAKNPSERYAAAADMADDLKLFLDNKPIRARRPSIPDRIVKWSRRHRPAVLWSLILLVGITIASSISAVWFAAERARVVRAEREKTKSLWDAYLSQANALRHGGEAGQRFAALAAISNATRLIPVEDLTGQQRIRLRSEAIAVMSLPDVKRIQRIEIPSSVIALDSRFERIATADAEGHIQITELKTGRHLMSFDGVQRPVSQLAFGPNGRYLLAKHQTHADADAVTCVWSVNDQTKTLEIETSARGKMDISKDGRFFSAVLPDNTIVVYELSTTNVQRIPAAEGSRPLQLKFSPDGRYLAVGQMHSDVVQIHDLEQQQSIRVIRNGAAVYALAWHSSGQYLAIGSSDYTTRVWSIRQLSTPISELKGHQAEVVDVAFNPVGDLLATASHDGTLRFWNAMTGEINCQAMGRLHRFSDDGSQLAVIRGHGQPHLEIWQVATGEEMRELVEDRTFKGPYSLRISSDGRLMATTGDDGIWLWDLRAGQAIHRLPVPGRTAFFYDEASELITISENGVLAWPLALSPASLRIGAPRKLGTINAPAYMIRGALCVQHGLLAYLENATQVAVWDLRKNKEAFRCQLDAPIQSIDLCENGAWLVTAGATCRVWALDGSSSVALDHSGGYPNCKFSPDGRTLVTGTTDDYRIWEAGTWRQLRRISLTDVLHSPVDFSADGQLVAIAESRYAVQLLDAKSWQTIASLRSRSPQHLSTITFTPDSAQLLVGSETNVIQIWDLESIWTELEPIGLAWPRNAMINANAMRLLDSSVPPLQVVDDYRTLD
ncbi:MAG: protein kinase [Planctomycetales bacterium]|nr:protein kinase [Planctomycetales bacterium]